MTLSANTVNNVQSIQWTKGQLDLMLFVLLGSEEMAYNWWITPNKAFDDRFPKDVYYLDPNGRKEVSDYINAFANGNYQ